MFRKLKELMPPQSAAGRRSVGMQSRLLTYWVLMVMAVFSALLLVLNVCGVFSGSEQRLNQALLVQQNNMAASLTEQISTLTARGIALSNEAGDTLDHLLYADEVSALNNDPRRLLELERRMYSSLNAAIHSSPCNGVYLIVDATTNTEAEGAETSRAGMYLRFANLSTKSAVNQDVVYFRGIPDVARENYLELHNRWNLEFDVSFLSGYQEMLEKQVSSLSDSCFWTGRMKLTDTWEDVIMLVVPIQSSGGVVQGACGIELSDLYFRLSYPAYRSEFGNMVTILAPMEEDKLQLSQGMNGGLEGTYLSDTDTLTVKDGKYFSTYVGESGTFLGMHSQINMEINGLPVYVATLISQECYNAMAAKSRVVWIVGSAAFLIVMLMLSIFLSQRFVRPISRSLAAIQAETPLEKEYSGISEIDSLLAFIQSKNQNLPLAESGLPPDIAELFNTFSQRAAGLTATERNIIRYYADGREISQVAELAFISIHTVRKHNANIYQKLGIGSRDELMLYIELFRRCGRLDELC